ncbi:hypothetical protein D3OALGA1CA_3 [Olavius algarvensis associated proteobacterium Delta 3]|nr:hypothetical protein D3OALGA1CA_3 [Olavius algarvensis associated proteobacterium Delta 3]
MDFSLQDESYGVIPELLRLNGFGKGTRRFPATAQESIVFLHPIRDVRVPSLWLRRIFHILQRKIHTLDLESGFGTKF